MTWILSTLFFAGLSLVFYVRYRIWRGRAKRYKERIAEIQRDLTLLKGKCSFTAVKKPKKKGRKNGT